MYQPQMQPMPQSYGNAPMQQRYQPQLQYSYENINGQPDQYHPSSFQSFPAGMMQCGYIGFDRLPEIAARLATAFSSKCNKTRAHIYTFNEHAYNQWSNPKFFESVEFTYYYANLSMLTGTYRDPNAAILNAVEKVSQFCIAETIRAFPIFNTLIPEPNLNAAQNAWPEIDNVRNEIGAMLRQTQQAQQQAYGIQNQQQGFQRQTNQPWPPQQQQPQSVFQTPGFQTGGAFNPHPMQTQQQWQQQRPPQMAGMSGVISGGIFSGQPQSQQNVRPQQPVMNEPADDRFAYLKKRAVSQQQPQQQQWQAQQQEQWFTPVQQPAQQPVQQQVREQAPAPQVFNAPPTVIRMPYTQSNDNPVVPEKKKRKLGQIGDEFWELDHMQYFNDVEWAPTQENPYPPAINIRKEILIKISSKSETGRRQVRYITGKIEDYELTEDEMNRQQQYVATKTTNLTEFTPKAKPVDLSAIVTEETSNKTTVTKTKVKDEMIDESMFDVDLDVIPPVMCLKEAVTMSNYLHYARNVGNNIPTSTRMETAVQKSFFSEEDHSDVLKTLSRTHSFQHLCNEMVKITSDRNSSKELLEFMGKLDTYLKNKLHRVIRYKLGLTNLTVDSFMEDAPNLIPFLNNNKGELYAKALSNNQKEFILTYLAPTEPVRFEDTTQKDEADDSTETEVEKPVIKTTGVQENITVTSIDLSSSQLGVSAVVNVASLVSASMLPELNNFIALTTDISLDPSSHYSAHYLLTNDDRLFELHKGYLSTQAIPSYLINEVILD